jgi:hypothetical protein
MGLKINKLKTYDIETCPSFSDAKFTTQKELKEIQYKRLLKERNLKINKLIKNVL